ncbi:hypothetical protein FOZ60_013820 [Perkinsus olseni]|uniref:EF-hand domain-containing protein n=2 Tax=Perkinsus olseni TaxID=32597 RepID=A0A7J6P849_PEROL|nr:hypothetical protein FOZ60_013820 [Perkinsus olseni]
MAEEGSVDPSSRVVKAVSVPRIHLHHHLHDHKQDSLVGGSTMGARTRHYVMDRSTVIADTQQNLDEGAEETPLSPHQLYSATIDGSGSVSTRRVRYESESNLPSHNWTLPWVPPLPIMVQKSIEERIETERKKKAGCRSASGTTGVHRDLADKRASTVDSPLDRRSASKSRNRVASSAGPHSARATAASRRNTQQKKARKTLPVADLRELGPVKALREALIIRSGSLKDAFRALDGNGNGEVGFSEFETGLRSLRIDTQRIASIDVRSLFKLLDVNRSGLLSLEEIFGDPTVEDNDEEPWPQLVTEENLDRLWMRYLKDTREMSKNSSRVPRWEACPSRGREVQLAQRRYRKWEVRKEELRRQLRENDEFSKQRKGICMSLARLSAKQHMGLQKLIDSSGAPNRRSGFTTRSAGIESTASSRLRRRATELRLKHRGNGRKCSDTAGTQEGPPVPAKRRGGTARTLPGMAHGRHAVDRGIALRVLYDFSNLNRDVAARAVMEAEKRELERMRERHRHMEGMVKELTALRRELCASTNVLAKVVGKKKTVKEDHRRSIGAQIVSSLGGLREVKAEPSDKVGFFAVDLSEAEQEIRTLAKKHGIPIPDAEVVYKSFREVDRDNSGAIERGNSIRS